MASVNEERRSSKIFIFFLLVVIVKTNLYISDKRPEAPPQMASMSECHVNGAHVYIYHINTLILILVLIIYIIYVTVRLNSIVLQCSIQSE